MNEGYLSRYEAVKERERERERRQMRGSSSPIIILWVLTAGRHEHHAGQGEEGNACKRANKTEEAGFTWLGTRELCLIVTGCSRKEEGAWWRVEVARAGTNGTWEQRLDRLGGNILSSSSGLEASEHLLWSAHPLSDCRGRESLSASGGQATVPTIRRQSVCVQLFVPSPG